MSSREKIYKETKVIKEISLYNLSMLCNGMMRAITLSSNISNPERDKWLAEEFEAHLGITREEGLKIIEEYTGLLEDEYNRIMEKYGATFLEEDYEKNKFNQ